MAQTRPPLRGEAEEAAGPDDFASVEEVLGRARTASCSSRRTARRTTPSATRASPRCPT